MAGFTSSGFTSSGFTVETPPLEEPVTFVFPVYAGPQEPILIKKKPRRYTQVDEFAVPIWTKQRDRFRIALTIRQTELFQLGVISLRTAYQNLLTAYENQTRLVKRLKLMWLSSF